MSKDLESVDWNDSVSNQQDGNFGIPNNYDNDSDHATWINNSDIDIQRARWDHAVEKSDLPDFGYDVDPIVNTED